METKRCSKCGQILPLEKFSKSEKSRDGYQSMCKACQAEYNRKRYEERRDKSKPHVMTIKDFTSRELMEELARRNYSGTLEYPVTTTKKIDITNF